MVSKISRQSTGVWANKTVIFAALGVLAVGYVITLLWRFEYVEKPVDIGPSLLARSDPWLAASNFMRQQGYTVLVDDRLDAIENLSELSTLIISRDDFLLTEIGRAHV